MSASPYPTWTCSGIPILIAVQASQALITGSAIRYRAAGRGPQTGERSGEGVGARRVRRQVEAHPVRGDALRSNGSGLMQRPLDGRRRSRAHRSLR